MAIVSSVGKGGGNISADVCTIQLALNISREQDHLSPISVDGIAGPQTFAAILDFQRRHTRLSDGRIDPHGPTFKELEKIVSPLAEARSRLAMTKVMERLALELQNRGLQVSPRHQSDWDMLNNAVRGLRGGAVVTMLEPAIFFPQRRPAVFQFAFAPAAAPVAAAAAAEAALLALLAAIALLLIIQAAPAMGRSLEDLARQIQTLMSKLVDAVKDGIKGIEDLVKKNSRAGMLCSGALILFRQLSQQLLDLLVAPRSGNELGRARRVREIANLFEKWQQALSELLACLVANGAV